MVSYKRQFDYFLKKHGLLPLNHWKFFELEHGKKAIFNENLTKISREVNKRSGIYIYKKGERILYIGKAVSLFGRLKSHNRESFEMVPGDRKDGSYHNFFSANNNCGKLNIFWMEIKIEEERVVFEAMLQHLLKPEFK